MPRAKSGGTGDGLNATAHRCRGDTAAAEISRCNRRRHGRDIGRATCPVKDAGNARQPRDSKIIPQCGEQLSCGT